MERRSATRNQPRKRYTIDAFEGIEELQDARSDSEDAPAEGDMDVDDESVRDFNVAAESSSDEDAMSGFEISLADEERDSDGAQSEDGTENEDIIGNKKTSRSRADVERQDTTASKFSITDFTPTKARVAPKRTNTTGVQTYNRGLNDTAYKGAGKDLKRLLHFGPNERDFRFFFEARSRWAFDPTFPSRVTNEKGFGGMHRSISSEHDAWVIEISRWRDWWVHGGGEHILSVRQVLEDLEEDTAKKYRPELQNGRVRFLMGPLKDMHLLELPVGGYVGLQAAWDSGPLQHNPSDSSSAVQKSGYMLYVGAKVQCIDWASNQNRKEQFLAVALSDPAKTWASSRPEVLQAPAFTPHPGYTSNIQIWRFESDSHGRIDRSSSPHLHSVLCTEWGGVRSLKWCPPVDETGNDNFCLLASIWTDGAVRVLHVDLTSSFGKTSFTYVKRASLEARPPTTVLTCLTWVSPTRIAAGCANGCVAVWDLPSVSHDSPDNARPCIYSAASTSYILSIASCAPSRPNLILTSSMGGFLGMTDLSRSAQSLASQASTVFGSRNRIGASLNAWHDLAQVALYVDDNYMLRGTPIRHIFATGVLARYRSSATCLATSPCHPFVLVGTANGDVVSSNPIERIIDTKAGVWQQTWFAHEWRRPTPEEEEERSHAEQQNGVREGSSDTTERRGLRIGPEGLTRITEGFKADRCVLWHNEQTTMNHKDGIAFTTTYEEKSAITALAWNPNLRVGGWAAVGMGDGLLRVEDIALDSMG